ncbi:MAG TPA: ribulose-phosphate 3-epimerase [Roseiflexaceae bacterium]|nr:ribulose-phosphate 3-epimerase [Roseiflexaceae bacterium]
MPLGSFGGRSILLAPSILSADFARLGDQVLAAQHAGADWLHIDVMDGMFVPNISIGPPVVAALREVVNIPLDCHLMIMQPERYIAEFVAAGAAGITVHVEACTHLHRTIEQIKEHGVRAGVVLNPATPLVTLEEVLPMVDLVLVMSVNPGFGGQRYIPSATRRIERLRRMLDEQRLDHVHLQVDGGVKADNIAEIVAAGATNLVVGSAIFNRRRTVAEEIHTLHSALGA